MSVNAKRLDVDAVPKTMHAAAIDRPGGPEVLSIHTLPVPHLDANEVLIAVDTAGVGRWDADMREGWSPSGRTHFPLVLGSDGAGIVAAVGARVRRFKPGDRVYAYSFANPKGGFYAEFVAVAVEGVAPVPAGLDLEHAGAVPTIGLTALQGVDEALRVKEGEAGLAHGAAGRGGLLALQIAEFPGGRVAGAARGGDRGAFLRRPCAGDGRGRQQ